MKREDIDTLINFLSLLITIVLSIIIYRLQRKHEKEMEHTRLKSEEDNRELELRMRKERLEYDAKKFLIDNSEEHEYLPLCIIATNLDELNKKGKHSRRIYNNFNRCSKALRDEILEQAGLNIRTINLESDDWIPKAISILEEDIIKYELSTISHCWLYGGAKYFHRILNYRNEKSENFVGGIGIYSDFLLNSEITVMDCVKNYLELKKETTLTYTEKEKNIYKIPPFDLITELKKLGQVKENVMCFWINQLVHASSFMLSKHSNYDFDDIGDAEIETNEDFYYCTLFHLFLNYGDKDIVNSWRR